MKHFTPSSSLKKYENISSNRLNFFLLLFFIIGTINFSNAQQAPIAVNDSIVVNGNTGSIVIDVQANDTEPNNGPLNTTIISNPTSGASVFIIDGDSILYTYPSNFSGEDTILYSVCNQSSLCDTATVFISVNSPVGIDLTENDFSNELLLYPNPTNGDFSINLGDNYQRIMLRVTDMLGRTIQVQEYNDRQLLNLKLEESAGIYFLIIESENKRAVMRLVKK